MNKTEWARELERWKPIRDHRTNGISSPIFKDVSKMHSKAGDFWKKRIRNLTSHHSTLLANIFYQENVQPVPSFVASRESLNQHQDSVVRNHKLLMLPLIVSNGKLWIVVSDRYKPGKCVKPGSRKNILLDETFYYPPDS